MYQAKTNKTTETRINLEGATKHPLEAENLDQGTPVVTLGVALASSSRPAASRVIAEKEEEIFPFQIH